MGLTLAELQRRNPSLVPMVGRREAMPYAEPKAHDLEVFSLDFEILAKQLDKAGLGASFRAARDLYEHALGVALSNLAEAENTFEGITCTSTWGMKLITPQELGIANIATAPIATVHSWEKSISLAAAENWGDILGTAAAPISPSSVADYKAVQAFHSLISYLPVKTLLELYIEIVSVPYSVQALEPVVKGAKDTEVVEIPLPSPMLIISSADYSIAGKFDKGAIGNTESVRTAIAPFGLVFAEYGYLKTRVK